MECKPASMVGKVSQKEETTTPIGLSPEVSAEERVTGPGCAVVKKNWLDVFVNRYQHGQFLVRSQKKKLTDSIDSNFTSDLLLKKSAKMFGILMRRNFSYS